MNKDKVKKILEILREEASGVHMEADKSSYAEIYTDGCLDAYESALDIIDQLDEPEKVIIPQFVADWYEQEGSRMKWWNWFYKWGGDQGDSRTELEKRVIEWMQDFNEGLFVDIFRYGYEIEKEPTWVVKLDDDFYVSKIFDGISQFQIDMASGIDVTEAVKFTDKRLAEAVALLVEGNVEETP